MGRRRGGKEEKKKNSGANLGFEAQLWKAAGALVGSMDNQSGEINTDIVEADLVYCVVALPGL